MPFPKRWRYFHFCNNAGGQPSTGSMTGTLRFSRSAANKAEGDQDILPASAP